MVFGQSIQIFRMEFAKKKNVKYYPNGFDILCVKGMINYFEML